ncbi:cell division ATP-binding protein FtsE [Conexibacter sp. W3-3-2]|uniref:cell division ATP-binding protein FtsE n=1 Tax=Conexibacter sp. W3-3-2 TaxID=2675227 RepID=UPI0021065131|nr:ATP-binding cassette domain-containing protein [Conexibacter sp. W3-3-2]
MDWPAARREPRAAGPPTRDADPSQTIVIEDVRATFPAADGARRRGLHQATLAIAPGEFVMVSGPTGCGKTTLLRLLHGEARPEKGRILVGGRDLRGLDVRAWRQSIGFSAQSWDLLPDRTVRENILFPLQILRRSPTASHARVEQLVAAFGLRHLADRMCDEKTLSGGERQRVSLARAVAHRPRLLLTDEPTGNLDPATSLGLLQILLTINAQGTTIVCATHDKLALDVLCTRTVRILDGHIHSDTVPH